VRDDLPPTMTILRAGKVSAPQPTQVLLRRRLLTLALAFTTIAGLVTAGIWFRVVLAMRDGVAVRPAAWTGLALYTSLLVFTATSARVLWSSRALSLRALRTVEVAGFSSLALCEVWRIAATWRAGEFFRYVTPDTVGMTLISSRQSLIWFALIVAYGTFIPNTWRRCAAVVGVLAVMPIAAVITCNAIFGGLDARLLSIFVFNLSTWMMFAAALGIYGSHRIDVLRHEAFEARKLGQYQLTRLLGTGGMGEVYLGEHLLLRRPCAIKLIRPDRAGDPENLLRFEREAHATAALTHANTVQVYDYGHTDDGTFYYVMEYLPGLTLEEVVQRDGPVSPPRVAHLLGQICGALQEAHAAGLIHRDVKPSNIIVCERGGVRDVAKLVDFGIVQMPGAINEDGPSSRPRVFAGTPSFMSPEQVSGAHAVDARSDVYSLGAVAYFLLTGFPPFGEASAAETAAAHLRADVVPPGEIRPGVPADLQSIVLRCLRKDPGERYQSAALLSGALWACASARA
jgi:serine/threonine-protein kinase